MAVEVAVDFPSHIDIFLPYRFLLNFPCVVLGYCYRDRISWQVNCLIAFSTVDLPLEQFKNILNKLQQYVKDTNKTEPNRAISVCRGYLNCRRDFPRIFKERDISENVEFVLKIQEDSFHVEKVWLRNNTVDQIKTTTLISYDCEEILRSELLTNDVNESTSTNKQFLEFIRWSSSGILLTHDVPDKNVAFCFERTQTSLLTIILVSTLANLIFLVLKVCVVMQILNIRIFAFLKRVLMLSACSRQSVRKFQQLQEVAHHLKNRNMNLRNANLLSALIVDMLCGIIVTYLLFQYVDPFALFSWIIDSTDIIVNKLQELLHWLMGIPAGLKLNRPLNNVLGRFFSYHIYLLKTYIVFIKPLVAYVLELSFSVGLLGASFILCLASDLFSLATIHIYCFYGYAARLYSLMVSGLVAFWRLFRGKKWNPLRKRVDSYHYDVQQLFIGTLMFTVLIFLLPTVAVYYAVFTLLRMFVLIFQQLMLWLAHILSILPVYVIILHLIGSNKIKGDIHFSVFSCSANTVTLTMKAIPLSLTTTIMQTIPECRTISPTELEWGNLLRSLLMGKIIYPL